MDNPKWLDHLEGVVPKHGYGNRMSMYLIALEAWRRGLKIKFYKEENPENKMYIRYTISDGTHEHRFESSMGDKLTSSAFEICENKDLTKSTLSSAGVPVPEGCRFPPSINKSEIIEYAKKIKFPVVVKPVAENAGKGVFPNILTETELKGTVKYVRRKLGYEDILVEKHFNGTEYRILIVDGKIVGAVNRLPANIIGDGERTIEQLIKKKNQSKKSNPIISTKSIEVDKEIINNLDANGYTLECILPKDKLIYLRNKSNVSRGGDPIDVTDELTDQMREIALNSVNAIEGLDICGLDMLVNEEDNTCVVIEINTKPMIGLHMYPIRGVGRDVVSPIIDHYFPQTKTVERSNLYFDFTAAIAPIRNYVANEVNLTPLDATQKEIAKQFSIYGKNLDASFQDKIRSKALEFKFNGFIKEVKSNEEIIIVISTEDEENLISFEAFIQMQSNEHSITNYERLDWMKPVNIGFFISRSSRSKTAIQRLRKDSRKLRRIIKQKSKKHNSEIVGKNNTIIRLDIEKQKLKDEIKSLNNDIEDIYNSRSWKLTQPLRNFTANKRKNN